jgi:predicted transglutaminase-like cysteine proteinase
MPQGESAAPPPGYVDLCQRDAFSCGATNVSSYMAAASDRALTTSSLGGGGLRPPPAHAALEEEEAASPLIQVTSLEAYRPAIDPSFAAIGEARVSEAQTADAPAPAASAAVAGVAMSGPATLNKSQMRLVNALNRDVNREIQKASDFDLYGLLEFWSLPRVIDGKMYGDCEDYALEKRRRLIAAGVPAQALSMAVAVTARGETHAVLVVAFESGDWVLDNLTPWATPWNDLNYHWVERQVPGTTEWKVIA